MRVSIRLAVLFFMLLLFAESCKEDEDEIAIEEMQSPHKMVLHWYQNDTETKAEFSIGMQWCFSFLGAQLEKGAWARGTRWIDDGRIEIDFKEMGFNENALNQLELLIDQFNKSEEATATGGIDAGRLVASIFNNSNHYYKIVGMPNTLQDFTSDYGFLQKRAAIIESGVAFGERIISMPQEDQSIQSIAYLAEELSGSLIDLSHSVKESEVMDIMPNGQLRFGIYNKNLELIGGADSGLSIAGKPAKCLWCHEVNIQKGIAAFTAVPTYFTPLQFDSIIDANRTVLNAYRASLSPEIDFNNNTQHTELEKLYLRYLEPSAKRLAAEWNISEAEVKQRLAAFPTHRNDEFNDFGDLYYRDEIEQFSPYQVLPSAASARETVENEPNLLP